MTPTRRTLVLGLGNPIMGDDGVGVAALQRLRTDWTLPPEVELVDGGTWGMNLLR
jgi:hydrogenase maturation protease